MAVVFTPYLRKAKERITTDDDGRERPERPDTDRTRPRKRWAAVAAAAAAAALLLARRSRRDESAENSP